MFCGRPCNRTRTAAAATPTGSSFALTNLLKSTSTATATGSSFTTSVPTQAGVGVITELASEVRNGCYYHFGVQGDGNMLIKYMSGPNMLHVVWASNTAGTADASLHLQGDGNLVLYSGSHARWASNSKHGAHLVMQGDGNLVLYDGNMHPHWATGTRERKPVAEASPDLLDEPFTHFQVACSHNTYIGGEQIGFDPASVAEVKRALDAGTRGIELDVYSDHNGNPEVHHAGWTNAVSFLECMRVIGRHGWERTSDPLFLFIENGVGSDETLNKMGHIIRQNIPESRLLPKDFKLKDAKLNELLNKFVILVINGKDGKMGGELEKLHFEWLCQWEKKNELANCGKAGTVASADEFKYKGAGGAPPDQLTRVYPAANWEKQGLDILSRQLWSSNYNPSALGGNATFLAMNYSNSDESHLKHLMRHTFKHSSIVPKVTFGGPVP